VDAISVTIVTFEHNLESVLKYDDDVYRLNDKSPDGCIDGLLLGCIDG
jgi:ABC-type Mn2+/Zn2+ transport system ATPase subunit